DEGGPTGLALGGSGPSVYHFRGTYGTDDLYEISPTPEAAWHLERLVSYDFLLRHPTLELALRPRAAGADLEESADLSFNGRVIQRIQLDAPAHVVTTLRLPFHVSAPNRVELQYSYRRPDRALDARYQVGRTGVKSPGD